MAEFGVPLEHSGDTLLSGLTCVMFFLGFLPNYKGKVSIVEAFPRVCSYVATYLLVDHFVDSADVDLKQKKSLLDWLETPEKDSPSGLEELCCKLKFHLDVLSTPYVPELVRMVRDSYKAQVSPNLGTKAYLQACKDKGAATALIGTRIIFGEELFTDEEHLVRLGYCAQLLDDITDCSSDITSGVHTACTHTVKKVGNVDRMVWELLYELSLLPEELDKYAKCMRWMAVYIAGRTKHTSKPLRTLLGLLPEKENKACLRAKIEKMLRTGYNID